MISPTTALVGVAAVLAIAAGGFLAGTEWEQGRAAEAEAEQLQATADRLSQALQDNQTLARERARRNEERTHARDNAYQAGLADAHRAARADCARDDQSMRVLNAAIDAANAAGAAAGRMPAEVPAAADADERQ
ncbi:hypothetical protein [Rhodocyclus purpureus]|uniref:hypothetical protein n=1 Tax=Rhodocyclus purpureus TaxID=1067 RepID=UPI0019140FF1|nr:hypothetical protein [Rhodocyclus purpureus]MBK5914577.1 hypothetical protein [Rhodocyclus purpureus]